MNPMILPRFGSIWPRFVKVAFRGRAFALIASLIKTPRRHQTHAESVLCWRTANFAEFSLHA